MLANLQRHKFILKNIEENQKSQLVKIKDIYSIIIIKARLSLAIVGITEYNYYSIGKNKYMLNYYDIKDLRLLNRDFNNITINPNIQILKNFLIKIILHMIFQEYQLIQIF